MELTIAEDAGPVPADGDIQITPLIDVADPTSTPFFVVLISAPGHGVLRLRLTRLEMMGLWAEAGNATGWGPAHQPAQAEP